MVNTQSFSLWAAKDSPSFLHGPLGKHIYAKSYCVAFQKGLQLWRIYAVDTKQDVRKALNN